MTPKADVKILVTGASGMLGRALMERLKSAGRETVGVSKSGRDGTIACDLADRAAVERLFREHRPGLTIHTAAYSDVDGCERDPGLAHAANALSTRHLVEASAPDLRPFIYVSTDYVFDGLKKTPYAEDDPTSPVNVYGITKLTGEYYAAEAAAPSAIVRTSWLFGPGNPKNFVNVITDRLTREKEVSVLDDQEDSPTSVEDLSEALVRIAARLAERRPREVYHFCNRGGTTRYAMTVKIRDLLGLKNVRVTKADRSQVQNRVAIRPAYAVMSTQRYEKAFGVKIRPWEEALREYLERYRKVRT